MALDEAINNETGEVREVLEITKLAPKNIGDPKPAGSLKADGDFIVLGTLMGIVTGVTVSKSPDQLKTYVGLKGAFEAVPTDAERPILHAGKCFMHESFMVPIIDQLGFDSETGKRREAEEGQSFASQVQFKAEVRAIKASNPIGYTWGLVNLMPPSAADPLAALRALPTPKHDATKQIAAPKGKK